MKKIILGILVVISTGSFTFGQDSTAPTIPRPVVIEEFTGTWCGFCYGVGMALDRVRERYSRDQVIILGYHVGDPYYIPFCDTRGFLYQVPGFPTSMFNGVIQRVGGSLEGDGELKVTAIFNDYILKIRAERDRTSSEIPFELKLTGHVGPTDPEMTLTVTSTTGYGRRVTAYFLITEDDVHVPPKEAYNGLLVYNDVVRADLGRKSVDLTSPGTVDLKVFYSGTIPHDSAENLHPVAFVQDMTTNEILGAVGMFHQSVSAWYLY